MEIANGDLNRTLAVVTPKREHKQLEGWQCGQFVHSTSRKKRPVNCFRNMDYIMCDEEDKENTLNRRVVKGRLSFMTSPVASQYNRKANETASRKSKVFAKDVPRGQHTEKWTFQRGQITKSPFQKRLDDSDIAQNKGIGCHTWINSKLREKQNVYENALVETVDYINERKRRKLETRNKKDLHVRFNLDNLSIHEPSLLAENELDKSIELSISDYSVSIDELSRNIFTESVLHKLTESTNSPTKSHDNVCNTSLVNKGVCNTFQAEPNVVNSSVPETEKNSSEDVSHMDWSSCDKPGDSSNNANCVGRINVDELLSNLSSFDQMSALSEPNKDSCQGANSSLASRSEINLGDISAISDLTTDVREHISTVDLAGLVANLHSTFSYPINSTLIEEHPSQLDEEIKSGCDKKYIKSPIQLPNQKEEPSLVFNKDGLIDSLNYSCKSTDSTSNESLDMGIRNSVNKVVSFSSSFSIASNDVIDSNNNPGSTSKVSTTSYSHRTPGDGNELSALDYGLLDLDSSCESSTLSFCVDDEPFEGDAGDATFTEEAPEGNCDVCKMKRQKGSINLTCQDSSNSTGDDNHDSDASKVEYTCNNEIKLLQSKLSTSYRLELQNCINRSNEVLQKFSLPKQSTSIHLNKLSGQNKHSINHSRDSSQADGSSFCNVSEHDSLDSGRGTSCSSDTLSTDNSNFDKSKKHVWHSTPSSTPENQAAKPILRYCNGKRVLEQAQEHNDDPGCSVTPKHCKTITSVDERALKDSTGKYLNTPRRKSRAAKMNSELRDYDRKAIRKKLKNFCKTLQQDNPEECLQDFGSI